MRVLTFGWEFPPHASGGLGMACQGLSRELVKTGVDVLFVLPRRQRVTNDCQFIFASDAEPSAGRLTQLQYPQTSNYSASTAWVTAWDPFGKRVGYSRRFIEEVYDFAARAATIAARERFDIIHAHDWTSYLAGIAAQATSGKPLILHVHATAFDQAGGGSVDPAIFAIEKAGFDAASKIITVSEFTRNIIIEKHGADPEKVAVVHNGIDVEEPTRHTPTLGELRAAGKRIVLYHGRITIQKGVDYFVRAAERVVAYDPNVIFVISGKGDMEGQIMQQVAAAGLSNHVRFAGALWYEERDRMYQSVDLVVMPSVSEPFGLVPLEAIQHGVPTLISKQSGVAEVVAHVLKVDFWDVDEMANKILAALRYDVLHAQLVKKGKREVMRISWQVAAHKVVHLYNAMLQWIERKFA